MKVLLKALLVLFLVFSRLFGQSTSPQGGLVMQADGRITQSQPEGTGVVFGPDHAYAIKAPKGWELDNGVLADQDVHAVFYMAGQTFQSSPAWMFSRVHPKRPEGFNKLVEMDLAESVDKTSKLIHWPDLKTADGRIARVYSIQGHKKFDPEWIAYIDAPTIVILVGCGVRDRKQFSKMQEPFSDLVRSIFWVADKVDNPDHQFKVEDLKPHPVNFHAK